MNKKINSEINFSDSDFKVKIGTTNKKNPETLYIQIGTYIKPSEIKPSYVDDVTLFDKSSKYFFKDKLKTSDIYNKNFILKNSSQSPYAYLKDLVLTYNHLFADKFVGFPVRPFK